MEEGRLLNRRGPLRMTRHASGDPAPIPGSGGEREKSAVNIIHYSRMLSIFQHIFLLFAEFAIEFASNARY